MKWITFILRLGMAWSALGARPPPTIVITSPPPRNWPLVYGFEFTMDGIVTSASLPNGTTVPVGVTRGSAAYQAEMARLYSICEETARTGDLPTIAHEYRSMGQLGRSRHDPYHWRGGPVTDLRDAVVEAKHAALDKLAETYGLTGQKPTDTFRALATAPSFIFTSLKPIQNKYPFAPWQLKGPQSRQDLKMSEFYLQKAWLEVMVTQFSQAVVEAGFHRSEIPWVWHDWGDHEPIYADFEFVHPAATHAICTAGIGECYLSFYESATFDKLGMLPCTRPGSVVVVADLQGAGLALWAEGINDCHLDSVRWNTWPELKPPSTGGETEWSAEVELKISRLPNDTASRANIRDGVILLLTGSAWNAALIDSLRQMTTASIHEISQPEFAASMSAATFARYEERMLARKCEVGIPYCCGSKLPTNQLDDSFVFQGRMQCKDKKACAWVEEEIIECIDDQQCVAETHLPLWCHPINHVCMSGDSWYPPGWKAGGTYEDVEQAAAEFELAARENAAAALLRDEDHFYIDGCETKEADCGWRVPQPDRRECPATSTGLWPDSIDAWVLAGKIACVNDQQCTDFCPGDLQSFCRRWRTQENECACGETWDAVRFEEDLRVHGEMMQRGGPWRIDNGCYD